MGLEPNIKSGEIITNKELMNIFRCGGQGGMRRSIKTNTLVLISDFTSNIYRNAEKRVGIWHFMGMGTDGNQKLEYRQNLTLYKSNENKVDLHLFKKIKKDEYEYISRVLLAGEPERVKENNDDINSREILLFPLLEVSKALDITNFLLEFSKEELINRNIIDPPRDMLTSNSAYPLMKLMKENDVDTLISQGGWFLHKSGYFHNSYATGKKMGKISDLIENNYIKLNDIFKRQNKFINPYFKDSSVYNAKKSIIPITGLEIEEPSQIRIKYLKIQDNHLDEPINFGAYNKNIKQNDNFYTSLLIGPNGTGKSLLISFVQRIFTDLYRLNVSKPTKLAKNIDYQLEYILGDYTYQVKQEKGKIIFFRNNMKISLKEMILPNKVISCAFTLQDRFSILNDQDQQIIDQYEYLGVKNYIKKGYIKDFSSVVASNIMLASLKDKQFLYNLKNITTFLDFNPEIQINFKLENGLIIEDILDENVLAKKQQNLSKKLRNFVSVKDILNFVRRVKNESYFQNKDDALFYLAENSLSINFNINNADKYETLYEDFEFIWHLIDLKILISPSIMLKKHNRWLPLEKASSGEFQYLSTMINILSKIEPNSLIIMDEPETSLHPTWQYRYMSQLQSIFKGFPSCHFIIATHSHFMVADLKPDYASIVTLTKDEQEQVKINFLDKLTFGRSVEDILYDVFDLPTNRNHYLANDLDDILADISLEKINEKTKEKVKKIKSVQKYLKKTDPLRELIEKISEKVDINV
ncbi:AAA family ATPase [Priestia filamentosa]|uniref:AAA family ATPase n=1 Tax=Priestia filamentosa TaxID=1402861 RepID=UPI00031BA1B1|nr:AAA family ATPase [Priestia filamentosa]